MLSFFRATISFVSLHFLFVQQALKNTQNIHFLRASNITHEVNFPSDKKMWISFILWRLVSVKKEKTIK